MTSKLATAVFCLVPLAATAAENSEQPASPFTTSAELGFLYQTGNTKSADIKTGFDLKYEQEKWKSIFEFDLLVKKTETEDEDGDTSMDTSDQKWELVSQTNYTLGVEEKNYVYGNFAYKDDRFSGFENQSSLSLGWGRRWYESETASFDADIGPGFKRDVLKDTDDSSGETSNSFIIQAQALYLRKLNEHVEFRQQFTAKYSPKSGENSTYKAESSITTKLIETLQLKFSFTIDHNTEVEDDKENTDTQTAMTLVYSF
ncbi:DUF481 domain-containing protein [Thalassomonas sp. RHCl1]|uniref:DUF481 domain-containing protein n=1 Tax=Thalassomonas sp. RHCl1 TaxID=2995320 RepID=UPI00248C9806|nr:DUF481 domain-containing protein [Thalassomonas sp. RHCl1]